MTGIKKILMLSFFLFLSVAALLFNSSWLKGRLSGEEDAKAAFSSEKSAWEQEKAALEQQIRTLQRENEWLKKQLNEGVPIEIKPGTGSLELANVLHKSGIIQDAGEFQRMLIRSNAMDHIVPGTYMIAPGTSYEAVIAQLTKGIIRP